MNTAKCIDIRYEAGDFYLSQGHKRNPNNTVSYEEDGYKVSRTGYGWAQHIKSSKLILIVEFNNQKHNIWIDRYFKEQIGKLTAKRRSVIFKTMPEYVEIIYNERMDGQIYYTVSEDSLAEWCEKVQIYL